MTDPLFDAAIAGDRLSLSRAISRIDNRSPGSLESVARLQPRRGLGPGAPMVLGITGPPGAGKSTFTNCVIARARARDQRVGVVAVDPSSPFSGGAILGDRLRMEAHAEDPNVFIRSLSSRGHLGGLSRAAGQVVDLMDAAGFDVIIVETVGVGQSELAVMEVVDTVLVVLTPESGDVVQTMKAGLLEVADVFAVNKADRVGAEALARNLEMMVHLDASTGPDGWTIPVRTCAAVDDVGVDEVVDSVTKHGRWLQGPGRRAWEARRAEGRLRTFLDVVSEDARVTARAALDGEGAAMRRELEQGLNPYVAAARWLADS